MKMSTKNHGIMDYLMGILLIISPWLFGFANGTAAQNIPVLFGVVMLVMTVCTDYEMGLFKLIGMKTHLALDIVAGLFLAASPWIFDFHHVVFVPHLVLGLVEAFTAIMTSGVPYTKGNVRTP